VQLTGKEFAILELMVLRRGMVLTKEAFLNHLYGGMDEPDMKIIDVFICKLRKKLAQAGAAHLIETIWGRGYLVREVGNNITSFQLLGLGYADCPTFYPPQIDLETASCHQAPPHCLGPMRRAP
jgi:hypothetical protein